MSEIGMDELENEFAEALDGLGQDAPEPEAAAPETPQAEESDIASDDGRLRNPETGQFETPEQRAERLYADKYKSPEELERGYLELAKLQAQQANEVGQWRQWAEYQAAQQQQAQEQATWDEERLSQWDEFAAEKPLEAAQMALQQQNKVLYERAMDTWYAEDPKSAARFETALTAQMQQAQMQQYMQPLLAQQQEQAQLSAYMAVRQRHPDIEQWADGITRASQINPYLLPVLQHGTPAEKEQALETLYYMARGMQGQPSPTPSPAGGVPPVPGQAQNGQRPYVASPSAIPAGVGPARTSAEALIDELWNSGLENG